MDKSVTISVKGMLLAGAVLLALVTAYLLGVAGDPPGAPAHADEGSEPAPRRLTMVGAGEASAVPDQVSFTVAVRVLDPQLETALDESSGTMDQVLDRLKQFGVGKSDMQTTGLSMDPVYDYPYNAPAVLKGYRVSQRARITVPELAKAGRAIAATVDVGGNRVRVSNISLGISDTDAVLALARKDAVEQATTKAEEYAEASGQALGDVLDLRELSTSPRPVVELSYQRAALAADKAVPIKAGESDLKVRVRVVWELR